MANLELRPCQVGPWPMNTYALVCPATKQSVLFDPGADPETLLALLTDTTPIAILLTHTHGDHIGVGGNASTTGGACHGASQCQPP
ncbi:MAG: MBL fold metallo-hydrolase [Caldilineaceae bacterium]